MRQQIHTKEKQKVTRRAFLAKSAAALSTPLLGGLISPFALPVSNVLAGEQKPFAGETLNLIVNAEPYAYAFRKHQETFEKTYGVKLNIEITGLGGPDYTKQMVEFTSESGLYDIVFMSPVWMADFSPYLEPLEPLAKKWNLDFKLDDIAESFRKVYNSWDGVWYTVPFDGDVHIFYYNKVAFETPDHQKRFQDKYGYPLQPPQTWDQWRDMAEFFTGWDWMGGGGDKRYGGGEALKSGNYPFWWWNSRFASNGGVYFDEEMKPLINTPAGTRALENMIASLDFYPPGVFTFGSPELKTALYKADVAMAWHWTSTGKLLEDPSVSQVVGKMGFGLVPGTLFGSELYRRPALASGWSIGINKFSKKKDAAIHLLYFYNSPEISLDTTIDPKTAVDPYRVSHFRSEKFRNAFTDAGPYLDAIEKTLPIAFPDLQIPGASEYTETLAFEISQALTKKKSPQQALDDAANTWNKITRRLGMESQKKAWKQQYSAMKAVGITYREM